MEIEQSGNKQALYYPITIKEKPSTLSFTVLPSSTPPSLRFVMSK
jgi:hypothetical protein